MRLSYHHISLAMILGLVIAFVWQHQHLEAQLETQRAELTNPAEVKTLVQRHQNAPSDRVVVHPDVDVAELQETVKRLQSEMQTLRQRLTTLTDQRAEKRPRFATPTANPTPPSDTSGERIHALREDVDALLTGAGVDSTEGKELVAAMVEQQRQEARSERHARWQRMREEADEAWVQDFGENAGLDTEQVTDLSNLLEAHRNAKRDLRRAMRRGESDFRTVQQQSEQLHEALNANVSELLTDAQFTLFLESQAERREAMRKIWH
jgi:hypothetical protein